MRSRSRYLVVLFISISAWPQSKQAALIESVNPFIGTAASGNTFPGATLPFGMVQISPDTRDDGWYRYSDGTIRGFSLTHISGAGCSIYADVPILPWSGGIETRSAADLSLPFSHENERAVPGYYAVTDANGVRSEMTVTRRAGIMRFTFPRGARRALIFKVGASATNSDPKRIADVSSIEIRGKNIVQGTVHSGGFCGVPGDYVLYFAAQFAEPVASFGVWTDMRQPGSFHAGACEATGHWSGAYVVFSSNTQPLRMKVAVSFVSVENAYANLQAEIPGWNFDKVRAAAGAVWERMLGRVRVDGGTADERTIFYTCLYHMLMSPNLFSDANGEYIGFDKRIRRLQSHEAQYANFSDWDSYRNVIQLQSLLTPAIVSQMMQSLVRDAGQSGWLPRWPVANDVSYVMGGDSSAILLATAYAFGARQFDAKTALLYSIKGATEPGVALHGNSERPFLGSYLAKGYVPIGGTNETGASVTLEYANADFAVSRLAESLGDTAEAARLLSSAQNWRTLFDRETGLIRPRTSSGEFLGDFDPVRLTPHHIYWDQVDQLGFEEGNTWHYTWMIPYNYGGLFALMGGNENVVPKLDKFFAKVSGWGLPNYTDANEPDFCAPYAYSWTGNAWKSEAVIDRIRRETFAAKPDGIPGNDDLGATSGVFVWSALGMYPVIPGVGGMVLGTPLFRSVNLRLGNGKTMEIVAQGKGIYVHAVKLNGVGYNSTWLPLKALTAQRNHLEFFLQTTPDRSWAAPPAAWPPSFDAPPIDRTSTSGRFAEAHTFDGSQ